MNETSTVVASDSSVYYSGRYWNDFESVREVINTRLTGSPKKRWYELFHELVGGRRYGRALFLNCGNGWVERELFQAGLFDEVIGLDYGAELLAFAQTEAQRIGMPARYVQADINKVDLGRFQFDLVVNHAAAHHIQFIDKVFRNIADHLPTEGVFLNMDYVGPHRNQYPQEQWDLMQALNLSLPESARSPMAYPDAQTMVRTDPSEAIHSELIVETFRRYFDVTLHTKAGGALAYPLLTHNEGLWSLNTGDREQVISRVMAADGEYLRANPDSSMFDLFFGRPKALRKRSAHQEAAWTLEEESREACAQAEGGLYHLAPLTAGRPAGFGKSSWTRTLVHSGFHEPEAEGTWTDGAVAVLRMKPPDHAPSRLRLRCSPLLGPGLSRQRVVACVNGLPVESFEVSGPGDLMIALPRLGGTDRLLVSLHLPDATSCVRLGTGPDARVLAVQFHEIELIG
jgi:SAM-dependent methyltransferase